VWAALLDAAGCRNPRRRLSAHLGAIHGPQFSGQRHPQLLRCTCCGDGQSVLAQQAAPLGGWPVRYAIAQAITATDSRGGLPLLPAALLAAATCIASSP